MTEQPHSETREQVARPRHYCSVVMCPNAADYFETVMYEGVDMILVRLCDYHKAMKKKTINNTLNKAKAANV